jgi:hypothetical protein
MTFIVGIRHSDWLQACQEMRTVSVRSPVSAATLKANGIITRSLPAETLNSSSSPCIWNGWTGGYSGSPTTRPSSASISTASGVYPFGIGRP